MEIGGSTRVFALLGDPVAHSVSPGMQNAAFHALGLDAVYVPMRCAEAAIGPIMESLARQGGGGNVTVPHKAAAAKALASLGGPALPVCNTFWANGGHIEGSETDSTGILSALAELGWRPEAGGDWCVIGAGGSARAALRAARRTGVRIAVHARSPARVDAFLASAREEGVEIVEPGACRVFVNCTPLGLDPTDTLPYPIDHIPAGALGLDLVYRRGETDWVRALRSSGRTAADGRVVLVEQGAASFEQWFPGVQAPREVMRAAVRAALE